MLKKSLLPLRSLPWLVLATGCTSQPARTDDPNLSGGLDDPTTSSSEPADSDGGGEGNGDGTTGDAATSGGDDTPDESSDGVDDTSGEPACDATLCGSECCGTDQECVLGQCLAACESGARCGADLDVCCAAGEVCLQPECVQPGAFCSDSYDCPEGEFCELEVNGSEPGGACLPQPAIVSCEVLPEFEDVEVALEWSWEEQQIISIPIVADIDGDNVPEVIVSTTYYDENGDGNEDGPGEGYITGIIVVFDGATGNEQFRIENTPEGCPASGNCTSYGSYGRSTIGVADVDGNGLPDIIYAGRPANSPLNRSRIHAVNGVGQRLWSSHTPQGADAFVYVRSGAPSFGNFDDDAASEIVIGATVIDNDGTVVWDQGGDGGLYGSPPGYRGPISAIADLTGDGKPEIISGQHAWEVGWLPGNPHPSVALFPLWDAGAPDGFPAVADLDQNGTPEVILVAGGTIRILEGATGLLWCGVDPTGAACAENNSLRTQPMAFPNQGVAEDRGGPPTVADFDNDGRPEFAAAGAGGYVVFDLNRDGEEIVQPSGALPPAPGAMFVRWAAQTQDGSSRSTGSSVFDFQGDGVAEVLYGDECFTRIYNGQTGEVILELESSSGTIHEYPIVADADGDGNSEILVVANDATAVEQCGQHPGYTPRRGLFVYGDVNDQWVRTRPVWNSHTYHVTNADSKGATPAQEIDNWSVPTLNNYRQNVQGEGVFNAPDLAADLTVNFDSCLDQEFEIQATVRNNGSLGVPAGISVSLYQGTDATGTLIGTAMTQTALLPGAFTTLNWTVPTAGGQSKSFFVVIDAVEGETPLAECIEDNNTASTETVACPIPG